MGRLTRPVSGHGPIEGPAKEAGRRRAYIGWASSALYGDQVEQVAVQMAYHFQAAGDAAKAEEYGTVAGEMARWLPAQDEPIRP